MMEYRKTGPTLRQTGLYDGLLLVDKPAGPTSHDVVAKIRRQFKFDKVGHGGTLDPQATGLLVILIERATKLSNHFLTSDKAYSGAMRLGTRTDTQDMQGKVLSESDYSGVTREQLEKELRNFTGDIMQTPPMVSAAKKDGVSLYKLARRGKVVDREPKLIHIYRFDLLDFAPPLASFSIECTKGTYVRTLCADIGDKLGCGACLQELRRTRSGSMKLEDAVTLDEIIKLDHEHLLARILPLHKVAAQILRERAALGLDS